MSGSIKITGMPHFIHVIKREKSVTDMKNFPGRTRFALEYQWKLKHVALNKTDFFLKPQRY